MALVKNNLQSSLLQLTGNAQGFPNSFEQAATNFANALNSYGSLVTPVSTTSAVATQAFITAFIASKSKNSIEILVDAVVAYCTSLAVGMTGFVGTPPPTSATLKSSLILASKKATDGGSAQDWSESAATAIDTYFKTGTATNITTGVIVPWT